MENNTFQLKLPDILYLAYTQNLIKCVILFGSYINNPNPKDIDLAIVTTHNNFYNFINMIQYNKQLRKYDISLIKEEEINHHKNFYFGGHGIYLVESLRNGITLIGNNQFIDYPKIYPNEIRKSIFERMKEYIYVLRKSYFNKTAEKKFYSRYEKMLKLSVFLLTNNYTFPEVLNITKKDIKISLQKNGFILERGNKKENIENIWIKINKQYS